MAVACPDCGKPRPSGSWPICDDGSGRHGHTFGGGSIGINVKSIHTSDRAVVYYNPRTGEHRTPGRSDQPIPEVYARQGYIRQELSTPQAIRDFERSTGLVHEQTHYNGSYAADALDDLTEQAKPLDMPETRILDEAYSDKSLLSA